MARVKKNRLSRGGSLWDITDQIGCYTKGVTEKSLTKSPTSPSRNQTAQLQVCGQRDCGIPCRACSS